MHGYYAHNGQFPYIIEGVVSQGVLPETIGQFLGRKDKNGKEIYEGDFLLGGVEGSAKPTLVEWTTKNTWIGMADGCARTIVGFDIEAYYFTWKDCEVIGNLYENPELLDHSYSST